jgi:hypothetical protein
MTVLSRTAFRTLGLAAMSCLFIQAASAAEAGKEIELITPAEAKYPPRPPVELRGPVPGPTVEVVSPPSDVPQTSPIRLILRFKAYGGASVDKDSVRLIYERTPPIELTPRVAPYFTDAGLVIEKAKVPPGTHLIRVQLKDSSDRIGRAFIAFRITR